MTVTTSGPRRKPRYRRLGFRTSTRSSGGDHETAREAVRSRATAAVSVVAMAAPAGADPSNAKNSITFVDAVCTNVNPPNIYMKLDFVVNGNGRAGAHTPAGIF